MSRRRWMKPKANIQKKRRRKKRIILAAVLALMAFVITTSILASKSIKDSDETIARVDQLIAEVEAGR